MEILNIKRSPINMDTELDDMQIRNLILNNKYQLGLIYFDEHRTPFSYMIIIDGLTTNDDQYRVSINIVDKTIYREVELTACGSGKRDKFKARIFNQRDLLYSMRASCYARDLLAALFEEAEQQQIGG